MSSSVFSELVGQEAAIVEIKRAVEAARFSAQRDNAVNITAENNTGNMIGEKSFCFTLQNPTESAQNLPELKKTAETAQYGNPKNPDDTRKPDVREENSQNPGEKSAINTADSVAPSNRNANIVCLQEAQTFQKAQTENRLSVAAMTHAWLLTGPPGSGRSLAARAFAAALECINPENPGCGECVACKSVMSGNHPDVVISSTDLVTISAQEVRNLVAQAYLAPASGRWRIFIVEDADRMLSRTTNVLLKAIEEPPEYTVWILCTTAPADVLPTIRSRCRNINLVTPGIHSVAAFLAKREGVELREALIAAQAAQSHIGLARALINDPGAKALRWRTLSIPVSIRGVADAVIAAKALNDTEYMLNPLESDEQNNPGTDIKNTVSAVSPSKANGKTVTLKHENTETGISRETFQEAAEKARIAKMEALGLDPNGKIPAALRAQISSSTDAKKRRKTRAQHDLIDRELIYLTGYFRDVLILQLGASVALINPDFQTSIEQRAGETKATQTLQVLDALTKARARLNANVAPQLLLEAVLIEIYLTAPEN